MIRPREVSRRRLKSRSSTAEGRFDELEKRQGLRNVERRSTEGLRAGLTAVTIVSRGTRFYFPQRNAPIMSAKSDVRSGAPQINSIHAKSAAQLMTADNENPLRKLIERGVNQGDLSVLDEVLDPGFVERQRLPPGVPPTSIA